MSFASLVRFIPRDFILSVAMVNVIVSLISLSYHLLITYRKTRFLCISFVSYNFPKLFDEL